MSHTRLNRPSRIAAALMISAVLAATAGCGSSDPVAAKTSEPPAAAASSAPPTVATSPTPTPTPTATVPASATPRPSATPTSDQNGNGDADDPNLPATAGGGVCSDLTSTEVGTAIGGKVSGKGVSGGGCRFSGSTPKARSLSVFEDTFTTMQAAKDGATSAVEGTPEDLAGIADGAFVVTGSMFGGPGVQGVGALHVGKRLITVTVNQNEGMTAAQVRSATVAGLRLVAGKVT